MDVIKANKEQAAREICLNADVETNSGGDDLTNTSVQSLAWRGITVTIKHFKTGLPVDILVSDGGHVEPGQLLALMGPSGSGKTTLLNVLSQRYAASNAKVQGNSYVNGRVIPLKTFRQISSYVEQEDVLIGSLTTQETLDFAARLSLPSSFSKKSRLHRVQELLQSFGLQGQAQTIIGTPIRRGISGGQKRRCSVASQLITGPKILFLDEPTSGLDSVSSYEVVSYIRTMAKKHNLIVIASIHQPSTATFQLFDQLLLLSGGKTCYFGPVPEVKDYFDGFGLHLPPQTNPAEWLLDLLNIDFATDRGAARAQLDAINSNWSKSVKAKALSDQVQGLIQMSQDIKISIEGRSLTRQLRLPLILLHRSFIKSYRDVVAYGVRIVMYTGLAIMMGTVWLRLDTDQASIQPFVNAIFFGSAFMSFMAVAAVPSILEDRSIYVKEKANGLYGATSFILSNFLIGLPYLFGISVLFSSITYWLSNFQPTAEAFFTWIMWLFLDLLAAESLVVLMVSIFPNFVISLALVAFANGLFMSVGGFLVSPKILNPFYKYVFHYIDYQAYVFSGMMVSEFSDRVYSCGQGCKCMYDTPLAPQCQIAGQGVLEVYGYSPGYTGTWVGILLGIICGLRLLGWIALLLRKS